MLRRLVVLLVRTLAVCTAGHTDGVVHPYFEHPMGQMHYFDLTGFSVTISLQSDGSTNFVAVVPPSGTDCNPTEADGEAASRSFDCAGVQGRLRYTGSGHLMCHVAATFSFRAAVANDVFVVTVGKNGTRLLDARTLVTLGNTIDHGASIHAYPFMENGDYLEIMVANTTRTARLRDRPPGRRTRSRCHASGH